MTNMSSFLSANHVGRNGGSSDAPGSIYGAFCLVSRGRIALDLLHTPLGLSRLIEMVVRYGQTLPTFEEELCYLTAKGEGRKHAPTNAMASQVASLSL